MSQSLCLSRQCLGLQTRIECVIRPLAGGRGLWTLLCAAGLAGAQPTAVRVQGPFYGSRKAEAVLEAIGRNLKEQGYVEAEEPYIWALHMQAELRKVNADQTLLPGGWQSTT